jgi:hypothetical protein
VDGTSMGCRLSTVEPRFELGPALQQASTLYHLSYVAPYLSYAATYLLSYAPPCSTQY